MLERRVSDDMGFVAFGLTSGRAAEVSEASENFFVPTKELRLNKYLSIQHLESKASSSLLRANRLFSPEPYVR